MKKTTLALIMATTLVSSSAFADTTPVNGTGFYLGADGGYSMVNVTPAQIDDVSFAQAQAYIQPYSAYVPYFRSRIRSQDGGFGFNLHGGYMFNQYIGMELGYVNFGDVNSERKSTAEVNAPEVGVAANASSNYATTYSLNAITLAAKGVYHFSFAPQLSVFGKLGVAEMFATSNSSDTATATAYEGETGQSISGSASGSLSGSASGVAPLVEAGLGYDVSSHFTINAGWSYIRGGNRMSSGDGTIDIDGQTANVPYNVALGNASLFYGGVDYHF